MAQKKLNIKGKYLVIGFIVLILVIGITAWMHISSQDKGSDGFSLSVARDGQVVKTFTLEEIKEMPSIEVYADLQSARHEKAEGNFKGVELRAVLKEADPSLEDECDTFICVAGDGYSSAISAKELKEKENAIVAYQQNGKDMEHFNEGGQGPMRLILAKDAYGNRSAKFLVRIECRE